MNPLDSNYAFSNAALGVFNSYTESNIRYGANMRQSLVEGFAQDGWKVSRRLSIDYGVRWTLGMPKVEPYGAPGGSRGGSAPSGTLTPAQLAEVRWLFCLAVPNLPKSIPPDIRKLLAKLVA